MSSTAATAVSPPATATGRGAVRSRAAKETLYLLLDLPVGVAGFTAAVTALSVAAGLSITLVGIPLLAASLMLARSAGRAERARARALLGVELAAPDPIRHEDALLARIVAPIRDAAAWRAMAYWVLKLPAGIATFTVAVTWWATALTLLTLPAWAWTQPHGGPAIGDGYRWSQPWQLAVASAAGLLLALAAPRVMHATASVSRALLRLVSR